MAIATVETKRYTVDDLADWPDDGKMRELVDGQIVEWGMTSVCHASLGALLTIVIGTYVRERRLGRVMDGEGTVSILGSEYHARKFDIAFYRRGRDSPQHHPHRARHQYQRGPGRGDRPGELRQCGVIGIG